MTKSTIIISDNQYLISGLKNLTVSPLLGEMDVCTHGVNAVRNMNHYDYIFIEIAYNQTGLCLRSLIKRKPQSRLFFIQKGISLVKNGAFLPCFRDAVILDRELTPYSISKRIKDTICTADQSQINFSDCCYRCRFPYISDTQLLIMIGYKNGFNAQELAKVLHLSHKTVFSHVHRVKEIFNLRGSHDIYAFLQNELHCYRPILLKKIS